MASSIRMFDSIVPPTVKDIARSVVKLNDLTIDRAWDGQDRQHVADNIAFVIGRNVRLSKITKRDVSIILASAGADAKTIDTHARDIAGRIRSNQKDGGFSAYI